jgi:hypothetical protein
MSGIPKQAPKLRLVKPTAAKAKAFNKWAWLDQVEADRLSVSHHDFRVAYVLVSRFVKGGDTAFPKQDEWAQAASITVRTLRRITSRFKAAGHLATTRRGKGQPNGHRLIPKNRVP